MKLKLTLGSGTNARDVQVTADVLATIGDVARNVNPADAPGSGAKVDQGLTLALREAGRTDVRILNPLLSIHESPLRSGASVQVVPADERNRASAGVPVASVLVVSGPDAGKAFHLVAGTNFVGRDPACQVRLTDREVSRSHARITVTDAVSIQDLNSGNGVQVDGRQTDRALLTGRSRITVGGTELRVAPLSASRSSVTQALAGQSQAPAGQSQTSTGRSATSTTSTILPGIELGQRQPDETVFTRSPRVDPAYRGTERPLPELPSVPERQRFPFLAVISPVLIGAGMFAIIQQPYILLFIALSPIIMLGTWVDSRLTNRRRTRDEHARFTEAIAETSRELTAERETEVRARMAESPPTSVVVAAARERSPLLWTRKPEHSTFLEVRLGTGAQPSRNTLRLPSRTMADLTYWEQVTAVAEQFRDVDGVPVIENLERCGALGIAGTGEVAMDVARSVLVQLVGLHSPADLVVCAFAGGEICAEWEWLKWLPHADSVFSPLRGSGLAADFSTASTLAAELEELIAVRRGANAGKGAQVRSRLRESVSADDLHGEPVDRLPALPAVVVLVTAETIVDRSRLVAIGDTGADVGVFLIWLAATAEQLPVVCRTFVEVDEATRVARVAFVRSGSVAALTAVEAVDSITAGTTARVLAPVEDDGALVLDESDLPHAVPLLSLFEEPIADDARAVTDRWVKTDSLTSRWVPGVDRDPGGIRALVGQGTASAMYLDLRRHGPHALVGGTTGSGKSEFLQTWIMALAAEYSPDRVTFLLVDYKGGAAFADCVGLPHTVGLVTDLNQHLVRRALTSLRAELRYRETLLGSKNAKDLEALERRGDRDAPPALVLVIDEFAALVSEVPEFVDGVVDIAQRGRSLGIHLIMATQRPAGIIRDNLRANTNLRVALRVADETDSVDVVGIPAAASFDPGTPGRAVAKLGPGRPVDFQTAYLGGRTGTTAPPPAVETAEFRFGSITPWRAARAEAPARGIPTGDDRRRDIERLAHTIGAAAAAQQLVAPRRPWLDELPHLIDLASLVGTDAGERGELVLGLLDDPENQRQLTFAIRPDVDGNVAVIGTGGTGRSTLLRSVAFAASGSAATDPVLIYALDFAGGGLAMLEQLPTVAAVIAGDDRERMNRVVKLLLSEVEDRTVRFSASRAGTLSQYRTATGRAEKRILVLLDGMAAFRADYEFASGPLFDNVLKLVSLGRAVGIHFIISADRYAAFPTAMLAGIQTRIVLRLASDSDHQIAGIAGDILTDAPAGRAVTGGREMQVAVAGGSSDLAAQADAVAALAERLRAAGVLPAAPVERLPESIDLRTFPATVDGRPTFGISDETLEPVGLPMDGLFVITGPFGSGRTTASTTAVQQVRRARPELRTYLVAARRSELTEAIEWTTSGIGADAGSLAIELAVELETSTGTPDLMVMIEQASDFEGLPAESDIARLIKAGRRAGAFIIAETDTVTAGSAWQIYTELKTARAGIVLQPEETDGVTLFRTAFPRVTRADFPVGRGVLVDAGRISRIQVGYPSSHDVFTVRGRH